MQEQTHRTKGDDEEKARSGVHCVCYRVKLRTKETNEIKNECME